MFFFRAPAHIVQKQMLSAYFVRTVPVVRSNAHRDWYSLGSQTRIDSSTRQHFFVEIGHEIISTTILTQPLNQIGQLPATVSLKV